MKKHLPCPDEKGCGSSDAYWDYGDHGYCFSCKKTFKKRDFELSFTYEYLPWRGITAETMEKFSVSTAVDEEGRPHSIGFPYGNGAVKARNLDRKEFWAKGPMGEATLFGKGVFSSGQAKSITICEGELDALSIFQMLGSKYPVVSIRSSSSAGKDCGKEFEYLNSFERIYLALDNDEVGQKASSEIARLFDFNKVYHVKMSQFKDANEYLTNDKGSEFARLWWNAKRYLPENIISSFTEFDKIIDEDTNKESVPYPYKVLNQKTYGLRTGEVVLVTAMEGIGKTEIIRGIEYCLLKETDANLGIIHLEETKPQTLKRLAAYDLQQPCHLPDSSVSDEELKEAIRRITSRDDRLHVYSHFGSDDPNVLLDTIRFMVSTCGCKYLFLDHITMCVTGLESEDERRTLDYLSTSLATMAHDLDFCLILVSHVNDDGRTRGSRNISKVADIWLHLDRDVESPVEEERNLTYISIKKNRFSGRTGPGGVLKFSSETYTISDFTPGELPT